jgi:uncharacterized protein (DUF1330 family)
MSFFMGASLCLFARRATPAAFAQIVGCRPASVKPVPAGGPRGILSPAARSATHRGDNIRETRMAKAYWVATYRSISNQDALAAYAKLAAPAIQAGGGRFLARGNPAKVYENGVAQRVVIIEFDSVEQAIAAHDSSGYQTALKEIKNGAVDREIRIIEGV